MAFDNADCNVFKITMKRDIRHVKFGSGISVAQHRSCEQEIIACLGC